jgi:hypothetical protein
MLAGLKLALWAGVPIWKNVGSLLSHIVPRAEPARTKIMAIGIRYFVMDFPPDFKGI